MNCDDVQEQLSARLDGELDDQSALLIDAHLQECELCRARHVSLTSLDASLTRVLSAESRRSAALAAGVLERLAPAVPAVQPAAPSWRRWSGYAISAAAGFVLALLWLQPEDRGLVQTVPADVLEDAAAPVDEAPPFSVPAPVARLVHATGSISYRTPDQSTWQSVDAAQLPTFSCPSDSVVKTEPGVLCELETDSGSRIRLNESSEIAFRSGEELELKQGQVWCRTPDMGRLCVVTSDDAPRARPSLEQWKLGCSNGTEMVTSRKSNEDLQVVSASGNVDVRVNGAEQSLPAGAHCTLSDEGLKVWHSEGELVDAERWMQPLLTLGGHGNPELFGRVDSLLARLGATKLAYLYEQDLRSLGEYGALPLMKYVQSDRSNAESGKRRTAVNILADTAPIWMVPDLIALLQDDDAEVRIAAARGLTRLTGETLGRAPEDWSEKSDEAYAQWQMWWAQHRFACPLPPQTPPAPGRAH